MQALTLEIIMRAVFGTRDERLRALLAQLLDWMGDPCAADAVVLAGERMIAGPVQAHALAGRRAAQRGDRAPPRWRRTCTSARTSCRCCCSTTDMDDRTLRHELLTLLVAGHETTATALSWALERLAHHPEAWERLRSETRTTSTRCARRRCACGRSCPRCCGC